MALFRAKKTVTFSNGILINVDSWTDQANPDTTHATSPLLETKLVNVADEKRIYMQIPLPEKPPDVDDSISYEGIVETTPAFKLTLWHESRSGSPGALRAITANEVLGTVQEGITWNNQPNTGTLITAGPALAAGDTGGDYHDWALGEFVLSLGKRWGDVIDIRLVSTDINLTDRFGSSENLTLSKRPTVSVEYYTKPPTIIDDLEIEPYIGDKKTPRLTWSSNEDEDFEKYQIWRKVGTAAYAKISTDITEQGTEEYIDSSGVPENTLTKYVVRVFNTNGSWRDSNEVWMVRPDVNYFAFSNPAPFVKDEITARVETDNYIKSLVRGDISFVAADKSINTVGGDFTTIFQPGDSITVSGSASNNGDFSVVTVTALKMTVQETIVNEGAGATITITNNSSTPAPVFDTKVIMDWTGEGLEKGAHTLDPAYNPIDEDGGAAGANPYQDYLKHRYFKAVDSPSVINPLVQVENSLGFLSDGTLLTTGGPTISVTSISPNGLIKANPYKAFPYFIHPISGTVTVGATAIVTGSNTKFLTEARVGDIFISELDTSRFYVVQSIESDTQLTLDVNHTGSGSGQDYMLIRNGTIRLLAEESHDRNSNGALIKYEFWLEGLKKTNYFVKSTGLWSFTPTWNDQGTIPYMDAPVFRIYDVGTVDVKQGSRTVIGNGTAFLTEDIKPGDVFATFGSKSYVIESIESNTELTLVDPYDEATQTVIDYIIIEILEDSSENFNAKVRVQNTFLKTDESPIIEIQSKPEAGIDVERILRCLKSNLSLRNPTDGREKEVVKIADSDDVEAYDEGRSITTMRTDGAIVKSQQQDPVENQLRDWNNSDKMLRVFFRNDRDRAYYYECKIVRIARTKTLKQTFEWNITWVVLWRVE